MTDSTSSSFGGEESPEADHNASVRLAITNSERGGLWVDDARMRAQRCLSYIRAGVGFKSGVQVSSYFVSELGWGEPAFMQELFDAYVSAGHIRLDEQLSGDLQGLPMEAAILNGNLSAVQACMRHGNIYATLSQPWKSKDGIIATTLEELADLSWRPGMREPIKAALSSWRSQEEALETAAMMRDVINCSAPASGSCLPRRRARADL